MKTSCRTIKLLFEAMAKNDSLVCCGLDPDSSKMPIELRGKSSDEKTVRTFLQIIINLTAPHICAYKLQKAFFDIYPKGHHLLRETIRYIHRNFPHLPVLIDAKIGDTSNTMAVYIKNIFGELGADGIVVNPYLGDDVMQPFKSLPDKVAVVAVKTSNHGASVVQDTILQNGLPLWRHVLDLTVNRWNRAGNMIPIISSTATIDLCDLRMTIPDNMPIFLAGYGIQGGSVNGLYNLVNSDGRGVLVNSSRGLLYPYNIHKREWQNAILLATIAMKNSLNYERSRSKFLLILGVSGVGKSTIIKELKKLDNRFTYISPLMTRGRRTGEIEKIPIRNSELDRLERENKLIAINELYGVRYATPREPIELAFRQENFPVLDWPIDRLSIMQQIFPGRLYTVYVEPPGIDILKRHLEDGRDKNRKRINAALRELSAVRKGTYDDCIDYRVINHEGSISKIAHSIYKSYLKLLDF